MMIGSFVYIQIVRMISKMRNVFQFLAWRMDLVRAILDETDHNLTLVPLFWQMHAKRADCTHKSLDAVMMMNEQLIRSMRKTTRGSFLTGERNLE